MLAQYGEYLDVVKLWDPHLRAPEKEIRKKIEVYNHYNVKVQPGGDLSQRREPAGQIVAGLKPGREREDENILFWHRGLSLSDIALGHAMGQAPDEGLRHWAAVTTGQGVTAENRLAGSALASTCCRTKASPTRRAASAAWNAVF